MEPDEFAIVYSPKNQSPFAERLSCCRAIVPRSQAVGQTYEQVLERAKKMPPPKCHPDYVFVRLEGLDKFEGTRRKIR